MCPIVTRPVEICSLLVPFQVEIYTTLEINQVSIKFKLDTDSQVNIIKKYVFKKLNSILSKTYVKLTSYSGDSIPIAGMCVLPYKEQHLECYVTCTYAKQPSVRISKCLHKIRMVETTIHHSY